MKLDQEQVQDHEGGKGPKPQSGFRHREGFGSRFDTIVANESISKVKKSHWSTWPVCNIWFGQLAHVGWLVACLDTWRRAPSPSSHLYMEADS